MVEDNGNIKSFNYGISDDYHHLSAHYYSICFRRARQMCKVVQQT